MAKKSNDDIFYGFILNEYQQKFVDAIMSDEYNFVLADATAGSGKTLLAVACANILVNRDHRYNSATFVFPVVEESSLGYRPGSTTEKEADYLEPLYQALIKCNVSPLKQSLLIFQTRTELPGSMLIPQRSCEALISKNKL